MQALCDSIIFQATFVWHWVSDHQKRIQTLRSLEIEVTIWGYETVVLSVAPAALPFYFFWTEASAVLAHYSTHPVQVNMHTHKAWIHIRSGEVGGLPAVSTAQEIQLSGQQDVSKTQPLLSSTFPPRVPQPLHPQASQPTPYHRSATPQAVPRPTEGPLLGSFSHTPLTAPLFPLKKSNYSGVAST